MSDDITRVAAGDRFPFNTGSLVYANVPSNDTTRGSTWAQHLCGMKKNPLYNQ